LATSNKNFKVKNGLDVNGAATASSFVKTGGTSAQFLMADGSISTGGGGGGGSSLEVSETPPASPSEGDTWYNSATGQTFVYYDSFWVENIGGVVGPAGPAGPTGPLGFPGGESELMTFSTSNSGSDPGTGTVRLNNSTRSAVTEIYIDNTNTAGATISTWLDTFANSNIVIRQRSFPNNNFSIYTVNSVTNSTGYRTLGVTHVSSSGSFTTTEGDLILTIERRGLTGATGPMYPVTISTSAPSGGNDGDLWFRYDA
jgi:hypothetical protein